MPEREWQGRSRTVTTVDEAEYQDTKELEFKLSKKEAHALLDILLTALRKDFESNQ